MPNKQKYTKFSIYSTSIILHVMYTVTPQRERIPVHGTSVLRAENYIVKLQPNTY